MSRVKQITLPLITLYLWIYSRITKVLLSVGFLNNVKKVRSALLRGKLAILYKLRAIGKMRYGHIWGQQVKEAKGFNYALWYNPNSFTSWYEGKILYVGIGMLTLSAVLLAGILIGIKQERWGAFPLREQQIEKPQENENMVIAKDLGAMPKSTVNVLPIAAPKEEAVSAPLVFHAIKGPIQVDFGWQLHPVYQDWRYHSGIDIAGSEGQAVHTICSGDVIDIVQDKNTGLTVIVEYNGYKVFYGSLSEVAVSKGSHVAIGQKIGKMGIFDREPYYHVHLAIKKGEQAIDPKVVISNE